MIVPVGVEPSPLAPVFMVTTSDVAISSEGSRRRAPSVFADNLDRWDFTGTAAIQRMVGTPWPTYEAVRAGVERQTGLNQRVFVAHLYGPGYTVVGFGRCLDDDQADAMVDQFREMVKAIGVE